MTSNASFLAAPSSALDIPETPDLATDAPRDRRTAAFGDGRSWRGRPDPAGKQQRRVRHRGQLAAGRCRAVARRAAGRCGARRRSAPAPVPAVPRGCLVESGLPADHLHGPVYLEFDEGVENFARAIEDLVPAAAVVAVDELTGAMRRAQPRLFRSGRPADAAQMVGAAKLVKTPDELACVRKACRITDAPSSMCKPRWRRVSGRSICRPDSSVAPSNSAPRPTCWRRSGR